MGEADFMSFSEVLAELPKLTLAERQFLMRRALELDEPELSPEDQALIDKRLADGRRSPKSSVSLAAMKRRLRERISR
jgi:hypothetical protein